MSALDNLQWLISNGYTQYRITQIIGLPQPTISRILTGETTDPSESTAEKILLLKLLCKHSVNLDSFKPKQHQHSESEKTPFELIVAHFGSAPKVAEALGITSMAVYQWKNRGNIPPTVAAKISALSGGKLTVVELCPDIFGGES